MSLIYERFRNEMAVCGGRVFAIYLRSWNIPLINIYLLAGDISYCPS